MPNWRAGGQNLKDAAQDIIGHRSPELLAWRDRHSGLIIQTMMDLDLFVNVYASEPGRNRLSSKSEYDPVSEQRQLRRFIGDLSWGARSMPILFVPPCSTPVGEANALAMEALIFDGRTRGVIETLRTKIPVTPREVFTRLLHGDETLEQISSGFRSMMANVPGVDFSKELALCDRLDAAAQDYRENVLTRENRAYFQRRAKQADGPALSQAR